MTYEFAKEVARSVTFYFFMLIFIMALTVWFGYDIRRRAARIQEGKGIIQTQSAAAGQVELLRRQAQEARAALPALQAALPPQDNLINFPKEVIAVARQRGIEAGFSFGAADPGTVLFTISAQGAAGALLDFIRSLEHMRYYVRINSVTLLLEGGRYAAHINGTIFSQ